MKKDTDGIIHSDLNECRVFGKPFLEIELEIGVSYDNPHFRMLGLKTANQMKELDIHTVLDYGAGVGVYSDAFHQEGFDVVAFEYFKSHREYMREKVPHIKIVDVPVTTDLMLFIETAEHMTDVELNDLFSQVEPTYILFSSTSEVNDQDELWGHVNVKPQIDWISYFSTLGYTLVKELPLPTTWTKLFQKNQAI
jgi:2-polyprenyl-3-methyl-5-hydroxy-6-metoxy-1,4-benzoquinol methylase